MRKTTTLLIISMSGCGTIYIKPRGTMQTESKVTTESTVTVKLDIAEQIEKICKDSKDMDKCREDVIGLFNSLMSAIKELEEKEKSK